MCLIHDCEIFASLCLKLYSYLHFPCFCWGWYLIWLVAAWAVGGPEEAGVRRRRPRPGTDEAEACRHNYCQAQPGSSSGNKHSDHISYSCMCCYVLLAWQENISCVINTTAQNDWTQQYVLLCRHRMGHVKTLSLRKANLNIDTALLLISFQYSERVLPILSTVHRDQLTVTMAISVDGDNQRDWIWWDHYPLHPDVQELQNYTVNIWKLTTDHCSCQLTHPVLGFYSVWLIWFKVSKVSVKTKRSVLYLFRALLKRVIRDYNTAIKGPIIKTIIHYLRKYIWTTDVFG